MEMRSVLVKFVGGMAFSVGLAQLLIELGQIFATVTACTVNHLSNCDQPPMRPFVFLLYLHLIFLMAIGLVLLSYDFPMFTKPAKKGKK